MTINEKIRACEDFMKALTEELKDDYELVAAFEKDKRGSDKYLVPKGTADQITYYGKPADSFRCSTHWNWRETLEKCNKENYIQCLNVDLPFAKKRIAEGEASEYIKAEQVAVLGTDGKYHAVFGEVFDRKKREWHWLEADPKDIALKYAKFEVN